MNTITYNPEHVCSRQISFDINDGVLTNVNFLSGCSGNLQGLSKLIEGMPVAEVIKRLKGIDCRGTGTSCPDQLVKALEKAIEELNIAI